MATSNRSQARASSPSAGRVSSPPTRPGGRILTLRVDNDGRKVEIFDYYLKPVACEEGPAFELSKLQGDGETYHVRIGEDASCECKGFLRWGHCKHVDSLTALKQSNRL